MTSQISKVEWFSPDEQMPDADLSVLVAVGGGLVEQGFWDGECWRWAYDQPVEGRIVAWAQLPQGPQ